jgi:hypothetical protein
VDNSWLLSYRYFVLNFLMLLGGLYVLFWVVYYGFIALGWIAAYIVGYVGIFFAPLHRATEKKETPTDPPTNLQ